RQLPVAGRTGRRAFAHGAGAPVAPGRLALLGVGVGVLAVASVASGWWAAWAHAAVPGVVAAGCAGALGLLAVRGRRDDA
ncbi:MAG: hypothetical protein ABMA64_42240, partial [Myxococcota bacterium]